MTKQKGVEVGRIAFNLFPLTFILYPLILNSLFRIPLSDLSFVFSHLSSDICRLSSVF